MSDNVAITSGTGTTIAADDVGGILHQRVKTTWGPDGTANDVDIATGRPLPVQLRSPAGADLTGAAGTGSAAVITVQGNASGTAVPVSVESVVGQAAALGTTKNALVGGSVTTASPTYTTGQINPLSLDLTGALRVNVTAGGAGGGAVTQSGTWTVQPGNTANTTAWLAKIGDGTNTAAIKAASTAPLAADPAIVVAISPNGVNANGINSIANSAPVVAAHLQYETVAASQTDQIMGATGGVGDYLEGVLCVVATAATSQVQIKDGNGTAITVLPNSVGAGVGSYYVPLGLVTANATTPGWKITSAAGVSVIGTGKFT